MAGGDGLDRVHVGNHAEKAHRADRLRPRGDGGFYAARVHEVRVGLDVYEDRGRARVQDRADGRIEGVRDGDHFVAGAQPQPGKDRHQRHCAVGHGQGMLGAAELRPARLEFGNLPTSGDHAAGEDFGDGGRFLGAEVGARGRNHSVAPRCGPVRSTSDPASLL